jgi:hypothetical protein
LALGIFILFKSLWNREKTREEREERGEGLGNKETEFASEIPTELPTVCCVFGTMNSIPSKTMEEEPSSSDAFLAFFLILYPKPSPDQIPLLSIRYGAVFLYLSYPIHFSMHIFTFFSFA